MLILSKLKIWLPFGFTLNFSSLFKYLSISNLKVYSPGKTLLKVIDPFTSVVPDSVSCSIGWELETTETPKTGIFC